MHRSTLATAMLVLCIVAGCGGVTPTASPAAAQPTSAATASPAVSPAAPGEAKALPRAAIEPGTYFGDADGTRYTFTIPAAGWKNYPESGCCTIYTGDDADGAIIFFSGDIASLYARACESSGTEFQFGPT